MRINPYNLILEKEDFKFAVSEGHNISYGKAGDCYSKSKQDCRKGQFKINLQGSNLKLDGNPQWIATGSPKGMAERITQFQKSPDNAIVSAHCGGSCSECIPEGDLKIIPDICAIPGTSVNKVRRSTEEKHLQKISEKHVRKRSSYWWWPF